MRSCTGHGRQLSRYIVVARSPISLNNYTLTGQPYLFAIPIMNRTQQNDPTSSGGQNQGAEPWNDSNNFGGARDHASGIPRGQNQDMQGA